MNWLSRVPIWGWFLFTLVLCYAAWNPTGYSLWDFNAGSHPLSVKLVVDALLLAALAVYLHETWRTYGAFGLLFVAVIFGAIVWSLHDLGAVSWSGAQSTFKWWGQLVVAFVLTLGFQGGRVYRNLTGRVSTSPDHDVVVEDHHG